jgi:hypothetical protein
MKKLHFVSRGLVRRAAGPGPWDFTNKVLYDLCQQHPTHTRQDVVLAKMLIIGRVHAFLSI